MISYTARVAKRREEDRKLTEPVSLAPLDPETALRALLRVKPAYPPASTEASGEDDEAPAE